MTLSYRPTHDKMSLYLAYMLMLRGVGLYACRQTRCRNATKQNKVKHSASPSAIRYK